MSAKKKAKQKAKQIQELKAQRQAKKDQNRVKRGAPISPGGGKHADKPKGKEFKSKKKRRRRPFE